MNFTPWASILVANILLTVTNESPLSYLDGNDAPFLALFTIKIPLLNLNVSPSVSSRHPSSIQPALASRPVALLHSPLVLSTTATLPASTKLPLEASITSLALAADIQIHDMAVTSLSSVVSYATSVSATSKATASSTSVSSAAQTSLADTDGTNRNNSKSCLGLGITYDPFTGSQTSARCKTEQEIMNEFGNMTSYEVVRIYGMDCNIIPIAMRNVIKNNQMLMAGAYLNGGSDGENLTTVIQTLHDAVTRYASGDWSFVQLFSVENEQVNDHAMTAAAVVDAINSARRQLQALGFNGLVGAVETVSAMIDNPSICQASDVAMVNCHAFFDAQTSAEDAGAFVKSQIARVQTACNAERVIVTESGWPHQGNANGKAVPSPENQQKAIASICERFDADLFVHNSFDSPWKSDNMYTFNAERFWGVVQ